MKLKVVVVVSDNRFERKETDHFKHFSHDELVARKKASQDIFCLKMKA